MTEQATGKVWGAQARPKQSGCLAWNPCRHSIPFAEHVDGLRQHRIDAARQNRLRRRLERLWQASLRWHGIADVSPGLERFDLPGGKAAPPVTAPALEEQSSTASPPSAPDAGRWEEEVARYETAARVAPPAAGAVVLLGASNIRMWETLAADFPGLEVVNRGVGGCKLTELAGFAPRLLAAAKPGAVVISAGSNDVHGGADAEADTILDALPYRRSWHHRTHLRMRGWSYA